MSATPTALIVIDVQEGFDDLDHWGPTTNPEAERNVERLVRAWRDEDRGPVVVVRHDSASPSSPLAAGSPGNALKPAVGEGEPDLLVTKQVNSAFYGTPDLHAWLQTQRLHDLVLCGIQTNMCVETTARMAGNLGYEVTVALDATRTFDLVLDDSPLGPIRMDADALMRATAVNLHGGRFATVTSTEALLGDDGERRLS